MEKDFSAKIRKAAWLVGSKWPLIYPNTSVCPKCHHQLFPLPDRPDIIIACEGIEVKEGEDRLAFNTISEGQREWADKRTEEGFKYWIALQLGRDRPDSKSINKKRAWLVPWTKWKEMEAIVSQYQKSLPLVISSRSKLQLKDNSLDAVNLLNNYELEWTNKSWKIPDSHPYNYSLQRKLKDLVPFSLSESNGIYTLTSSNIILSSDNFDTLIEQLEIL
jgi:hypothetical protein